MCALALLLGGCAVKEAEEESFFGETAETEAILQKQFPEILTQENREGELVFSISIEDFVEGFNCLYAGDYGRNYLLPPEEWQTYTLNSAIHTDYETVCFYFSEDEKVLSLPTMTVYVPTDSDTIQEVTINFDEHSYTEATYAMYEQMCFYTLKVFFPTLSEEAVVELYQEANRLGNEKVFSSEAWYDNGAVPCALFFQDDIGVYPYFAIGDWVRLCVIPVSEAVVEDFRQKGVEIHEIS